jgi:hypothetical protein
MSFSYRYLNEIVMHNHEAFLGRTTSNHVVRVSNVGMVS